MTLEFELEGEYSSSARRDDDPTILPDRPQATTSERPWFMSVSLGTRPRCFGCGGRMLPKVVVFDGGFAICEICTSIDWSHQQPLWRALDSLGAVGELSRNRGIIFWTPPSSLPDIDGYLRWMELWDIMKRPRTVKRPLGENSDISQYYDDTAVRNAPDEAQHVYDNPAPSLSGTDGC